MLNVRRHGALLRSRFMDITLKLEMLHSWIMVQSYA